MVKHVAYERERPATIPRQYDNTTTVFYIGQDTRELE